MKAEVRYCCDQCHKDLTTTEYLFDYRLTLKAERFINPDGRRDKMNMPSPLKDAHHFCNRQCLKKWVMEKL